MKAIIEHAGTQAGNPEAADPELAAKIGALYADFMDEAAIESAGAAPLAPQLAAIERRGSIAAVVRLMGELDRDRRQHPLWRLCQQRRRQPGPLPAAPFPGGAWACPTSPTTAKKSSRPSAPPMWRMCRRCWNWPASPTPPRRPRASWPWRPRSPPRTGTR